MASASLTIAILGSGIVVLTAALGIAGGAAAVGQIVVVTSAFYVSGFAFAAVALNALVARLAGPVRGSAIAFFVFVAFTGASIGVPLGTALADVPFAATVAAMAAISAVVALSIVVAIAPERRTGLVLPSAPASK